MVRTNRYLPLRMASGEMFCTSPVRLVEARDLSAVDDIRIERIGRDVAVLLDADRMPVAKRDRAVVAAAYDAAEPLSCWPP